MLQLEPFDPSCCSQLISWIDSPSALMQFAGPLFSFPLTEAQLRSSLAHPQRHAFSAAGDDNRLAAYGEIYLAEDGSAVLGRIIIHPGRRGKGLCREWVALLATHARVFFRRSTVRLNVFDHNTAAI